MNTTTTITCPTCQAPAGARCTTATGRTLTPAKTHRTRTTPATPKLATGDYADHDGTTVRITATRTVQLTPDAPAFTLATVTTTDGSYHPEVPLADLTPVTLIPLAQITPEHAAQLWAQATPVDDDYLARFAAELGIDPTPADTDTTPAAPVIETDDTIRWIGKTQKWVVIGIDHDNGTAEVETSWGGFGRGRTWRYVSRTVRLDRIELVRKGNTDKDLTDAMNACEAAGRPVSEAYAMVGL